MFLWGEQYLAQHREPLSWVVQDLIPVGGLSNLFGRPKAGKSFYALQMASAISSGLPHFLGFPILKHGPVAYIQVDTSASLWFERVKDHCKEWVGLGFTFNNMAFADTDTGTPFPLNILADAPTIKAALASIKPVLVIWDTIREVHPGNENESDVMKNVVAMIQDASRGEGWTAANLLLSHRKKENPNYEDDLMNANRGSSYIPGKMDSIIQLTKKNNAPDGNMEFQSRTHEFERRKLLFNADTFLWTLDTDEQHKMAAIDQVLQLALSQRQQATELAKLLKIEPEAARSLLRRRMKAFRKT